MRTIEAKSTTGSRLLVTQVDDSSFPSNGNREPSHIKSFERQLYYPDSIPSPDIRSEVQETMMRIAQIDPKYGTHAYGYRQAVAWLETRLSSIDSAALRVINAAYKQLQQGKNLGSLPKFLPEQPSNPASVVRLALQQLNQRYGGEIEVVGIHSGQVCRNNWVRVQTPFGIDQMGEWNLPRAEEGVPENATYGDIVSKKLGFRLGDSVTFKDHTNPGNSILVTGRVMQASHDHDGLEQGTCRFKIIDEAGTEYVTTPWSLCPPLPKIS
jgi:hypothetical protein